MPTMLNLQAFSLLDAQVERFCLFAFPVKFCAIRYKYTIRVFNFMR